METFEKCSDEHDQCLRNERIGVGSDNIAGCYVPTMQCSSEMNVYNDNIDDDFSHHEEMWSQLEEKKTIHPLQNQSTGSIGRRRITYFLQAFRRSVPEIKRQSLKSIFCPKTSFQDAFDSDKYAMTPTKLSQHRIDEVINSGIDSPHDTLPINAETRDSSDEGLVELKSSSRMDISGCHSGEKQKGSARRSKGKAKKIGSTDLSYLLEYLASVSEALSASRQIYQEEVSSCRQCIKELVAIRKVPKGSALYNFALTFLVNRKNRKGFAAAEEPEYKLGWIQYNFDQINK
ncbi:Uncharacterized protein Fot_32106 [Forsythia ovata]|uniref:Uncharacterized protein n=1 Tax=Forsythia ovata TaxID=205694 RepID=A0ABD1T6V5_9LAMI